jgi:hypothetical protein
MDVPLFIPRTVKSNAGPATRGFTIEPILVSYLRPYLLKGGLSRSRKVAALNLLHRSLAR